MAHMITSTCDRCKKTETKEWKGTLDHCGESFKKHYTSNRSMLLCEECKCLVDEREDIITKNRQTALSEACENVNRGFNSRLEELYSFIPKEDTDEA